MSWLLLGMLLDSELKLLTMKLGDSFTVCTRLSLLLVVTISTFPLTVGVGFLQHLLVLKTM